MALPPFLQPLAGFSETSPRQCVFEHNARLGAAHSLWWSSHGVCKAVILFLPGNPGLLGFYIPFLSAIHARDTSGALAIFGHAHLGHTPDIEDLTQRHADSSLFAQVESAVEALDAIKNSFGSKTKVVIIGHSVGAWIALQVLKARPDDVSAEFLLFPTICHIRETPNGRRLAWLFRHPFRRIVSTSSYITRLLPDAILSLLFPAWPSTQLLVLRSLLNSPESIHACLTMADEEMKAIHDLDIDLLWEHRHRLSMYFSDQDEWVGEQRNVITRCFRADPGDIRVVHGQHDIPHAFCINHSNDIAMQCHQWLSETLADESSKS